MDQGQFVSFRPANGSSALALYPREVLADDAGVPPAGSGFHGVTFSYVVRSDERVDAVLAEAERAGGAIAKPAQRARWGGYFGYFADPDGYLWKVVAGAGDRRRRFHRIADRRPTQQQRPRKASTWQPPGPTATPLTRPTSTS